MTTLWLDPKDALYRVVAPDVVQAGNALREHLLARKEIGKWTPVTVEFVTATNNGNLYREV